MILNQKFFHLQYLFGMVLVSSNLYVLHGNEDINSGFDGIYSQSDISLECTVDSSVLRGITVAQGVVSVERNIMT